MRRIYKFLGFAFIVLSVLGCTLPSSVKVKGNPKLKFAANMDFSNMFSDMIDEAFSGSQGNNLNILEAPNSPSSYKTFVIHMPVFQEALNFPEIPLNEAITVTLPNGETITIDTGSASFTLTSDMNLADIGQIVLPLGDGFGEFLEGFTFDTTDVKAHMYITGTGIVEKLAIDMDFGGIKKHQEPIDIKASGITADDDQFEGSALPTGTLDVTDVVTNMLTNQANITVTPKVYLPKDTVITREMLTESGSVSVEMAIWFPLSLKAGSGSMVNIDGISKSGAKLSFDELASAGEFITQLTGAEILEHMTLELGMTPRNHPLKDAWLIIEDKNNPSFVIANKADSDSINFSLTSSQIKRINNSSNYDPKLSVFFQENATLGIPKEDALGITSISIEAGISINVFGGEE